MLCGADCGSTLPSYGLRRCDADLRDLYTASYRLAGSDAGRQHCDTDSLQSLSVSSASSFSGCQQHTAAVDME